MLGPVDRARLEVAAEAVGHDGEALGVDVEQEAGAPQPLRAADDEPVAPRRPVAHPPCPASRRAAQPAGVPLAIRSSISSSEPWIVADHRGPGKRPRRRLVERREVMEVEQVGRIGARQLELAGPRARPGARTASSPRPRSRGPRRPAGPRRRRASAPFRAPPSKRSGSLAVERRREVDRAQVEPGVEVLARRRARRCPSASRPRASPRCRCAAARSRSPGTRVPSRPAGRSRSPSGP